MINIEGMMKHRKIFFGIVPVSLVTILGIFYYKYSSEIVPLMVIAGALWGAAFLFIGFAFFGIKHDLNEEVKNNKIEGKVEEDSLDVSYAKEHLVAEITQDVKELEMELLSDSVLDPTQERDEKKKRDAA